MATYDLSELDILGADLGEVADTAGQYVRAAVDGTSFKVKDATIKSVRAGSKRWKALPRAIDYEVTVFQGFGVSVIKSDIGYNKEKDAGKLGNIREYGSSRVAPHNDLVNALHENEADFEHGLDEALEDAEAVLRAKGSIGLTSLAVLRGRYR